MPIIIVVIIAFLVVVLLYQLIHRALVKRAILMMQRQAQRATDGVVLSLLSQLAPTVAPAESQLVADVWGKGVLAFEYVLDLAAAPATEKNQLQEAPVRAAINQQEAGMYLVTDWWTYEQTLHIEVAQLSNEATKEYVHDLKKLNQ